LISAGVRVVLGGRSCRGHLILPCVRVELLSIRIARDRKQEQKEGCGSHASVLSLRCLDQRSHEPDVSPFSARGCQAPCALQPLCFQPCSPLALTLRATLRDAWSSTAPHRPRLILILLRSGRTRVILSFAMPFLRAPRTTHGKRLFRARSLFPLGQVRLPSHTRVAAVRRRPLEELAQD
jgi:hypothetical protein